MLRSPILNTKIELFNYTAPRSVAYDLKSEDKIHQNTQLMVK